MSGETPGAELPAAATAGITAALGAGAIRPMELHRFALEQIAQAHAAVDAGLTGRALVEIP